MSALSPTGFLSIGAADLEYRMIGPAPADAPTIVMLHEGLGCAALWGDFPDKLQAATGVGVLAYSRAGYGASSGVELPRPLDYMHREALEVLPKLLDEIGFRRGLLLGHSDGASIAAIYAGSFLLMSVVFAAMNWTILFRKDHLLAGPIDAATRRTIITRGVAGLLPYLAATILAVLSPYVSLAICGAVAAFYALPLASGDEETAAPA